MKHNDTVYRNDLNVASSYYPMNDELLNQGKYLLRNGIINSL